VTHPAPALPDWIERQLDQHIPDRERCLVDVGEHQMHVMTVGPADAPAVLLQHGNPTWSFLWRKVAGRLHALFEGGLRLVMPDLVGLGYSDKPREPAAHTVDNHAHWLADACDRLGLGEMVFVGQDWGGPIGALMLARHPERARGMVILNTVLGPPSPNFEPTAFHRFAALPVVSTVAFRVFGYPQRALHQAQGDESSIRGDVARAYREPLSGWKNNVAPLAMARMVPDSLDHPSVPALREVGEFVEAFDGPAEIVWGDKDPVLGRLKKRIARALPQAEVTSTDAGHFLQEEVPDEIAAAVWRVARIALS
jgi:haloalkane dehalogenase